MTSRHCACGKPWLPQADGCPECGGTGETIYGAKKVPGDRWHAPTLVGGTAVPCPACRGRRRPVCPDKDCPLRYAASPLAEIADWWPELLDSRELPNTRHWPKDSSMVSPEEAERRAEEAAREWAERNEFQQAQGSRPPVSLDVLVAIRAVFEGLPRLSATVNTTLGRTVPTSCRQIILRLPGLDEPELQRVTTEARRLVGLLRTGVGTREPVGRLGEFTCPIVRPDSRECGEPLRIWHWQAVVRCVSEACRCQLLDCPCRDGQGHAWRYDPNPKHDDWGLLARMLGCSVGELDGATEDAEVAA